MRRESTKNSRKRAHISNDEDESGQVECDFVPETDIKSVGRLADPCVVVQ